MNADKPRSFPDALERLCNTSTVVRVNFWWLECDAWPEGRFVYGSVIPARVVRAETWFRRDVAANPFPVRQVEDDGTGARSKEPSSAKRRLVRYTLDMFADTARIWVDEFRGGKSVGELSREAAPSGLDASSACSRFAMDHTWSSLPTAYLSGVPSQSVLAPHYRARTSLLNGVGCFCTRHRSQDPLGFLHDEVAPDEVLRWLAKELQAESGVTFARGEGDAFGSFEIFAFPSLGEREAPLLRVRTDTAADGATTVITLDVPALEGKDSFLAQVRTELLGNVVLDELVTFESNGTAALTVYDPLDGILVRVWQRAEGHHWQLWDETELHFIRTIGGQLNLMGLTGQAGALWLEKDRQRPKLKSRVEAFEKLAQVSMTVPIGISNRKPFESAVLASRRAVERVHPEKSEARFFSKDWGTQENRLEFAEWLKGTLSQPASRVVLLDPYFDVLGLDLLFRASGVAKELLVVTSTQLKSDDDEGKKSRKERLLESARRYAWLLSGTRLKLCDLRRGGKGSVFHDRYMLVYGDDGQVKKGYNLSTSLQSAATTSPLLVTPIPFDVLDAVADYISGLMSPDDDASLRIETLFPEARGEQRMGRVSVGVARSVLRALAAAGRSVDVDVEDPLAALTSMGVYDGETIKIEWSHVELTQLCIALETSPIAGAAATWEGLVQTQLAGWDGGTPQLFSRLAACEPFVAFLERYLVAQGRGDIVDDDAARYARTRAVRLREDFWTVLPHAAQLYDHHHALPLGSSWPIHWALLGLITRSPLALDELVCQLLQARGETVAQIGAFHGGKRARREVQSALLQELSLEVIFTAIVDVVTQYAQGHHLAMPVDFHRSNVPFVRAIAAVALWRQVQRKNKTFAGFFSTLSQYSTPERQDVWAQVVYDLRVAANQTQMRAGDSSGRNQLPVLPADIVAAVLESLEAGTTVERLVALVRRYSGPILGTWALSTNNELLNPLVLRGKLTENELFIVWDRVLDERMQDKYLSESDTDVVQVWGGCVWHISEARRQGVLDRLQKELSSATTILGEPFLRARNYARWSEGEQKALWTFFRLWSIECSPASTGTSPLLTELLASAVQLVRDERLASSAGGLTKKFAELTLTYLDERGKAAAPVERSDP